MWPPSVYILGGTRSSVRDETMPPAKTYEAGINQRTVIIEFDSVTQAIAAHDSPGYHAALKALDSKAKRDVRIIEGIG